MANTPKEKVLERLCMLCTEVMHTQFKYDLPAGCICEAAEKSDDPFQFDEQILEYIEKAVRAKLVVDRVTK